MPVIPAKAGGSEFEVSLSYITRPYCKKARERERENISVLICKT
jgi:hypothetical protein